MLPPRHADGYAELRQLPIFDGVSGELLAKASNRGQLSVYDLPRDTLVSTSIGSGFQPNDTLLIVGGQLAFGIFEEPALRERLGEQQRFYDMTPDEREELSALVPSPVARMALKNLALFADGELCVPGVVSSMNDCIAAAYTVAPARVVSMAPGPLAEMASSYRFFEERLRRAHTLARERLSEVSGVKQELLDFFVRHGVSVAGDIVRVRQLDLCIDCKLCEQACEDRYGAQRLVLGGYQLGMLDFIYTCRTCTDQRCVDPCDYDSISYDSERREVVINEASCTGCTLCAQNCPYDAIEMVDVEDAGHPTYSPAFKLRLDQAGALRFGSGTPRLARPRRIANKCDHCASYFDQACVSACPTGSLIEVSAQELFSERSQQVAAVARAGFDRDVPADERERLPLSPFSDGVGVRDGGLARTRRGRVWPILFWGVSLAVWLLALVEVLLREYAPASSLAYSRFRGDGMTHENALANVSFNPGDELAIWCGYVGTVLLFIAAIYPFMRRVSAFRFLASNTLWFDFHLMAGVVGPLFIFLHAANHIVSKIPAGAFWAMVIVVISGFIGRYLYTKVPDLLNGRHLQELKCRNTLSSLKASHSGAVRECENELAQYQRACQRAAQRLGLFGVMIWVTWQDLVGPLRWWRRRGRLAKYRLPRNTAKALRRATAQLLVIERGHVLLPRAKNLLNAWKKVHVPFTILLVILAVIHIVEAWERA